MKSVKPTKQFRMKAAGLSLVELLVALTIGGILLAGAANIYGSSKKAYTDNEAIARVQETARYAMNVLEQDISLAGNWGLVRADAASSVNNNGIAGPAKCGANFATSFIPIQAYDSAYLPAGYTSACDPYSNPQIAGGLRITTSDTLVIQHASSTISAPTANTLQICSTFILANLSSSGAACPGIGSQINNLDANIYYVSRDSIQQAGVPSLRRYRLTGGAGGPDFTGEEVTAGVEDMQIQFGIDPNPQGARTGIAQTYSDPSAGIGVGDVVAVRIWLLARSDTPELGFIDTRIYEYGNRSQNNGVTKDLNNPVDANKAYEPGLNPPANGPTDVMLYRRILVSRTIFIRNADGT